MVIVIMMFISLILFFQAKKDDGKVNIGYFFLNLCALSL